MCRDCGQFNTRNVHRVARVKLTNGSEVVIPEQTVIRKNGRTYRAMQLLSEIWRTDESKRMRDFDGNFVTVNGNEIDKIVADTITVTTYQGEVISISS